MRIYSKDLKEVDEVIKKYKNKGEETRISIPVEYNGKLYREVMFIHKGKNRVAVGYSYIDEENNEVEDKSVIRQLAKLGYYLNIFYNDESNLYLKKAMEGINSIKSQKIEYSFICKALDKIKEEGEEGTEEIRAIAKQVIDLREENDEKILKLLTIADNSISQENNYGENSFQELHNLYRDIMMLNFKRVKLIESGEAYYENILKRCKTHRGFLASIFLGKKKYLPFMKLESLINEYKKILATYEKILDMNETKYEKFLMNVEKDNVNLKMSVVRNKENFK